MAARSSGASFQPSQPSLYSSAPLAGGGITALKGTVQHPKQRPLSLSGQSEWITQWITDWWGSELICWTIAVLSLVAIVVTLESYKNKPVPEWPFGITLNSLISIFSTIGQMAMMEPIIECISQLKWLWFMQQRKLLEFQAFDDASRGPVGSFLLLGRLHGKRLVCLGAALTIVSAAFGPFSQQVVTYPLRLYPTGAAYTPQVFNYTAASQSGGWPAPIVTASFYEGLALGNSNLSTITPSCSTGNCTWTEYASLGVCGSVMDVSSSLRNTTCNTTAFDTIFQQIGFPNPGYQCFNYSLPETAFSDVIDNGISTMNASLSNEAVDNVYGPNTMPVLSMSSSYANISSLISAYIIYQPGFLTSINISLPSPLAYQLNLNPCVQTYNTTVTNGEVNTTMISSQILQTDIELSYNESDNSNDYLANNSYVTFQNNVFGFSNDSLELLNTALQSSLEFACYEIIGFQAEDFDQSFCDSSPGIQFLNVLNSADPLVGVTNMWDNLMMSMTNTFRTPASEDTGAGGDTVLRQFEGKALTPVAFVETDYRWLSLPIGLIFFTLVFLLATIRKSRRLGSRIWKSSNLATLQCLHGDLHTHLGGLSSISEMDEKAKDVRVRFDMKGGKAEHGVEYRLVEIKQKAGWRG